MGVDYTGQYGIGVRLTNIDLDDEESEDDMYDYIENLPEPVGFETEYFEVGQGSYTGEADDYFLCIRNPEVHNLKEFKKKVKLFKKYLKENKIQYEGKIDSVGGLLIH